MRVVFLTHNFPRWPGDLSGSFLGTLATALVERGVGGAILFVIGLLAGIAALVLRFGYGIGLRPLLDLVSTMVISGIVLFGFGFLGEMIAGMREETREIARGLARLEKPDVRD